MTPATQIKHLHVKGFRSLADVEISDMPRAAIMIGPNGSGKSNVIDFFVMVHRMLESGKLDDFVRRNGGAGEQLFGGRNTTRHIEAHIVLGADKCTAEYAFKLACSHPDRFVFADERYRSAPDGSAGELSWEHLGSGHGEAKIREVRAEERAAQLGVNHQAARTVSNLLRNVAAYHFHDTFFGSWSMIQIVMVPFASTSSGSCRYLMASLLKNGMGQSSLDGDTLKAVRSSELT